MKLYVLDTDMLTLVEEGHPAVSQRFLQCQPGEVAITVLSVEDPEPFPRAGAVLQEPSATRAHSHRVAPPPRAGCSLAWC